MDQVFAVRQVCEKSLANDEDLFWASSLECHEWIEFGMKRYESWNRKGISE